MNTKRTLRLRKEVLTELTDHELRSIEGAADEDTTTTVTTITITTTVTILTVPSLYRCPTAVGCTGE